MNDEPKIWKKQYYSNFGGKEFLRLACFVNLWLWLGMGMKGIFNSAWIMVVFSALLMVHLLLALVWKPMYILHRKILGNPNLPTEPMPYRRIQAPRPTSQPIASWYYAPAVLVTILKMV